MEDSDVCPLCCEELDISDRQFFPCKCGYQVCMWCWHRIRESESGLCPACRTPYGDDPHEFSAVDMEEVLKENKAKAAAEKRERERLRQESGADGETLLGGGGPMALPKDRNQLANMRVIRRNLVYAVGLPPSIASEEILRKPEYFGQYGKISKIVLNRNNTTSSDPRRASASAYVTFVHKEDTLACILALDGFYIDGRNVRASYGTSKYCSAFIKNVRCNNPECTYLHCMGDAEDTFTKQEIQAGYVTSGRDVLARQQQIVAQALSAAAGGGAAGGGTRRKVGGGGPSGTGKASSNPIFPPPSYDEAIKSSSLTRSSSGAAFPSATASASAAAGGSQKLVRSMSLGASPPGPSATTAAAAPKGAIGGVGVPAAGLPGRSKSVIGATTPSTGGIPAAAGTSSATVSGSVIGGTAATAASVVAGVRNPSSAAEAPAPHTTLTPLTKLKRSTTMPTKNTPGVAGVKSNGGEPEVQLPPNMPFPKGLTAEQREALLEQRRESMAAMAKQQREMALKLAALRSGGLKQNAAIGPHGTAPTSPSSSVSSTSGPPVPSSKLPSTNNNSTIAGPGSIGGTVIGGGGPAPSAPIGAGAIGGGFSGPSSLGGQPIGELPSSGPAFASTLGGEVYTGHLHSSSAVGRGSDKWNSQPSNSGLFGNSSSSFCGGGIWGGESSATAPGNSRGVDGGFSSAGTIGQGASHGVIGGGGGGKAVGTIGGSHGPGGNVIGFGSNQAGYSSGSSALASMLGISLPTGSGSLRESTSLWESSTPAQPPIGSARGVIGSGTGVIGSKPSSTHIGGYAIGGGRPLSNSGMASNPGGGSNNSDIALLQSLLPGVHITKGNAQQPAAPTTSFGAVGGAGWDSGSNQGGGFYGNQPQGNNNTWGGRAGGGMQPAPVGANTSQQNQKQNQSSSIW